MLLAYRYYIIGIIPLDKHLWAILPVFTCRLNFLYKYMGGDSLMDLWVFFQNISAYTI